MSAQTMWVSIITKYILDVAQVIQSTATTGFTASTSHSICGKPSTASEVLH
jgi:hypothetical protein